MWCLTLIREFGIIKGGLGIFLPNARRKEMEQNKMNQQWRNFALIMMAVLLLATGCGPILSTGRISDAKEALEKAEAANAAERAPYEYTMAQEYLRKADELWGYSQFGYSSDYAQKAIDMATAAEEKAQKSPWVSPLVNANH